jgi:hypothetical protein
MLCTQLPQQVTCEIIQAIFIGRKRMSRRQNHQSPNVKVKGRVSLKGRRDSCQAVRGEIGRGKQKKGHTYYH